ncbi:MAG: segregation/condensation protein A [Planctomycetota bacterium]
MSYRVQLPVFSGPMDLLLHLVRKQEVDIHEISIAKILADYLEHLEVLRQLDLQDIGDFIVMASSLMEIKSRELLPSEAVELEAELDPRDDLIRRLLEYKRYRDLARELDSRMERRARQAPLLVSVPKDLADAEEEQSLDLGDVQVWDLTEAFARLLAEIGQQGPMRVEVDTRDVGFYTRKLLDLFREKAERRFEEVFDRSQGRLCLIGTLIALLEMMKQGYVRAHQEDCRGPIHLAYRGGAGVTAEMILAGIEAEQQALREQQAALEGHGGGDALENGASAARDGASADPGGLSPLP